MTRQFQPGPLVFGRLAHRTAVRRPSAAMRPAFIPRTGPRPGEDEPSLSNRYLTKITKQG
jgi:hypothetical protein